MNGFTSLRRFNLALTLGAAATLPAMAQKATPDAAAPQSSLTRTQVVAELANAQANGGMQVFSVGHTEPVQVGQSREAVRLATLLAFSSGEVAAINHAAPDVLALLPPGSWTEADPRMEAVPALGQHTDNILASLGPDAAAIARLRSAGAV